MKKKSLLLAIAAMSMAAVGVGTVGTFAWYQATQSNKLANTKLENNTYAISGNDPASAAVQNVYLKISLPALDDDPVDLTTMDMMTTGITTEGRESWTKSTDAYGHVALTAQSTRATAASKADNKYGWQWYDDADCTTGHELSNEAVANIKSATVRVDADAGSRLRITTVNPATASASDAANLEDNSACKKFYTAFNGKLAAQDVEVGTLSVADAGAVTGTIEFWYSIAGETPDIIKHDYVDKSYESAIATADLTVTFALVVTAANPA